VSHPIASSSPGLPPAAQAGCSLAGVGAFPLCCGKKPATEPEGFILEFPPARCPLPPGVGPSGALRRRLASVTRPLAVHSGAAS
jgi:hypothetical protein